MHIHLMLHAYTYIHRIHTYIYRTLHAHTYIAHNIHIPHTYIHIPHTTCMHIHRTLHTYAACYMHTHTSHTTYICRIHTYTAHYIHMCEWVYTYVYIYIIDMYVCACACSLPRMSASLASPCSRTRSIIFDRHSRAWPRSASVQFFLTQSHCAINVSKQL